MAVYAPTIGLEVHAELRTRTKMFCASPNNPDETRPNVNICPVCLAHPGTLPVINAEAVRHVLRVGAALSSALADYTEFDRKNYFYPDLPKGYQLSQYEFPLVSGGELAGVSLTRIHLEEDTASSVHDEATGQTTVDYNRAGVPLLELVTDPVIGSAEQAGEFARELQLLLRYLGASDANMEKGEMRVEANVSVGIDGQRGTKVEIKNLNSFNAMERAIRYEVERHKAMLEKGEHIVQETRGWDEKKQATFAQRAKEGSADYRYFPEPDLPSLKLREIEGMNATSLRAGMPELPGERRARYRAQGVKEDDAAAFVRDTRFGDFFDSVTEGLPDAQRVLASNYVANDLVRIFRDMQARDTILLDKIPLSARAFRKLLELVASSKISSRAAKDVLVEMIEKGTDPEEIAEKRGFSKPVDQSTLDSVVQRVLSANAPTVTAYKTGKAAALEYLVGQCMKELQGAGDPSALREALKRQLGAT